MKRLFLLSACCTGDQNNSKIVEILDDYRNDKHFMIVFFFPAVLLLVPAWMCVKVCFSVRCNYYLFPANSSDCLNVNMWEFVYMKPLFPICRFVCSSFCVLFDGTFFFLPHRLFWLLLCGCVRVCVCCV